MNKAESKKQFGRNLKRLRMAKGMSQEELAKALGYTNRSSINKIEIGRSSIPTDKIKQTADILGVSPLDLFEENPDSAPKPRPKTFNVKDFFNEMFAADEYAEEAFEFDDYDSEYNEDEDEYIPVPPEKHISIKSEEADAFKVLIDDYFSLSDRSRDQVANYIRFLKEQEKNNEHT